MPHSEFDESNNEFRQRLTFETLLSNISTQFINLPADQIDYSIEGAQRQICECLGFDLSALWQWSAEKPRLMTLTHLHSPPGGLSQPLYIDGAEAFPWAYEKLLNGETLTIATEQLPAEASRDRDSRRHFGIKSSVIVPLKTGGKPIIGALSFDTLRAEHTWSTESVKRLELVAQVFCNALARKQDDARLRESEMHHKRLESELKERLDEVETLKQQLEGENYYLREELQKEQGFEQIVGNSKALKKVLMASSQVAATDATVLILGETGTGKGLLANAIHMMSFRKDKPFITVNCAALPANLIESELFGREKGAFTGAHARQAGRFEVADRGTIFLDEIGEMPLDLQAKLLRVLQDGEFERLGCTRTIKVDARVIAATARDLSAEVSNSRFRQDLFYRLNVFPITIPPLRQRTEDIILLTQHFIEKYGRRMGKRIDSIPKNCIDEMLHYDWPGNVRELEHLVERSVIISSGTSFTLGDRLESSSTTVLHKESEKDLASIERNHIVQVLRMTQWKIEGPGGAASILDLHPSTLRFRIKKLGIHRPS